MRTHYEVSTRNFNANAEAHEFFNKMLKLGVRRQDNVSDPLDCKYHFTTTTEYMAVKIRELFEGIQFLSGGMVHYHAETDSDILKRDLRMHDMCMNHRRESISSFAANAASSKQYEV